MQRMPRHGPPPHSSIDPIPTSPIYSPEPPPGSNGLGRWVAQQVGSILAHIHTLQAGHDRQAEHLMDLRDRITMLEAHEEAHHHPSLKEKAEELRAVGVMLVWLAAGVLGLLNALSIADPERLKKVIAALSALATGSPASH